MRQPGNTTRPDLPLAVIVGIGGLGTAIARRVGATHRLLLADRDAERLEAVSAQLRSEGHDASGHVCDLSDTAQVDALAAAAPDYRAVIHVAALSPSMGDWRPILTVNWLGARRSEAAFVRHARKGCVALFVSSIAAHGFTPDEATIAALDADLDDRALERLEAAFAEHTPSDAYRLSKFAMNRMCRKRAAAWGKRGARIVSLSPGLIATPMGALEFQGSPGKMALYEKSPLEREGTMIEVAAAAEFLISNAASFISGTDLLVDGGLAGALQFPETP